VDIVVSVGLGFPIPAPPAFRIPIFLTTDSELPRESFGFWIRDHLTWRERYIQVIPLEHQSNDVYAYLFQYFSVDGESAAIYTGDICMTNFVCIDLFSQGPV
jgi:hypothetical protein